MTEAEQDKMVVIKVLYIRMNWSFRRIGRLLCTDSRAVKVLYDRALDDITPDNLHNLPKSRKNIDLRYVGDTSDVEYLEGHINHNVCGGGRKVVQDCEY